MTSFFLVALRSAGHAARRAGALLLVSVLLSGPVRLALAADAPASLPAPTSLGVALLAVVDEGMAKVAALETQAKAAVDGKQALETQAQIVAAKEGMQRRLLEVQLDFARREGNAELVAQLEGIIARLDAPAVGVPQDHPAPADAPAGR